MDNPDGTWTRRRFLHMVGAAGGSAAVYETMVALGLLRTPEAFAGPPELPQGVGTGQSVLVLGAGVGGLALAYRLQQVGYEVTILEAQSRAGGRSYTVRQGDVIHQIGHEDQVSRFDAGLYFNAGPGRLPYHHQAVLSLCRELEVPLEVYVMESRANLFQTQNAFGARPVRNRQVANDTRGYVSELLAKAVRKHALDDELDQEDRQRLLNLLVTFGDLNRQAGYKYEGSSRSGFRVEPGVEGAGVIEPPLKLKDLLSSRFWRHRFYQPEDYEWQTTLFEPSGGMDQIVKALERQARQIILNAEVLQVFNGDDGVRVVYRDRVSGERAEAKADYCVSNIPLPILNGTIQNGTFSADYQKAVGLCRFANAFKVGWQAEERFWESKKEQIYGGISWIEHDITQMWYPSSGFLSKQQKKGALTGAYTYAKVAGKFGDMSLRDRLQHALEGAERLHPDFAKHVKVDLGLSIAWQLVPFQLGGWSEWDWSKEDQQDAYERLLEPDKRFYVVGDQMSYLPGWQEGAVLSAYHVAELITGVKKAVVRLEAVGAARRSTARITGAEQPEE